MTDRKQELISRLDDNLSDYREHLMGFDKPEIIDMAARAAVMADTHMYLTKMHDFDEGEIEYLLNFSNPLEVVADAWSERLADMSDLSYTIRGVCRDTQALDTYPLAPEQALHVDNYPIQEKPNTRTSSMNELLLPVEDEPHMRDGVENIRGYTIKQSIVFSDDRGFALGEHPGSPSPYVTWQFTEESGKPRDYYWGKYFSTVEAAAASFAARVADHRETYGVAEKKPSVIEHLKAKQHATRREKPLDKPRVTKDEPR